MFKLIYSFLFCLITFLSFAQQQQSNIWLFGTGSKGITFDPITHIPSITTGKYTPYGNEGCSVATNPSTGALLFYSDGIRVVDAGNQLMPNGSGLQGNSSSAQNAWVCGVPGNCNQYYVFSSAAAYEANPSGGLYYSIVDMSLPGNGTVTNPKGDVVPGEKSILISSTGSEALTIIKSTTYGEYWLLSIAFNTNSIHIYRITATAIQLSGTYSDPSIIYTDPRNIRYSEAAKKFSITSAIEDVPVFIGDFNPSDGRITSLTAIPGTPFVPVYQIYYGCYDSEWSADGTKLYIGKYRWQPTTGGGRVFQYDFLNPTASPKLIFNAGTPVTNVVAGLKRGPDNKIYVLYNSDVNGYRYIGRIENPNAVATSVVFTATGIDMGVGYPSSAKFPEFMIFDNHKPLAVDDDKRSTCTQQAFDIDVLANDTDPDNNALHSTVIKTYKGTSTLNGNGTIHYIPLTGYSGNDTIWYTACDNACVSLCDTAYVLICNTVPCSNNHPIPAPDAFACIYDSTSFVLFDVLKNDTDPESDDLYIPSAYVVAAHGQVSVVDDTLLMYRPKPGFSGNDIISYTICDTSTCGNSCVSTGVTICVLTSPIKIPNLFTPNGDNYNDVFFIEGLYPNTKVSIYNRWGELIYETNNYDNTWGKNEKVTDGIYYCQVVDAIRGKTYKSWLQVLGKK